MTDKQNKHTEDTVRIRELEEKLVEKDAEITRLRQKLERMNEILLNADRARFGQSSEKKTYVLNDGSEQLQLFDEAEAEQNVKAPEPTVDDVQVEVAAHKRAKKRTIDEKYEGLPVQQVILTMPEDKLKCEQCGGKYVLIGKKVVRREMILIPQQEYIVEYVTCTYACHDCENKTGYANIIETVAPPPLMKHSLASPSTVADIMTRKYVDGLPLARQEKVWKREGIELSRATMANWVIKCSEDWLKPVYRRMKHHLIEDSCVIHADETVVQVLKEPGKAAASESRMWVYATGERSGKQVRIFEYQPDRNGERAARFLKGYDKCLVTDGYAGYNKVSGVTRCGCWAHMRRKWREAMPKGATTQTSQAAIGYEYCNKLFSLEKKFAELSDVEREKMRQMKAVPLLDAYWSWVEALDVVSGSKLADAVTYAKNQKTSLMAFADHGEVDISNNPAENAIRPFVVGRKNWLFSDTVKGAVASSVVYSLVETAKANGVEPYAYLLRLLSIMPTLGKTPPNDELDKLMPWHPEMLASLKSKSNT